MELRNLTPNENSYQVYACPAIYEITPEEDSCALLSCPAIYELTTQDQMCLVGACPSINSFEDSYLIVGKQINPKEVGLEKKVGKGEVLIKIKKEIIDNKKTFP